MLFLLNLTRPSIDISAENSNVPCTGQAHSLRREANPEASWRLMSCERGLQCESKGVKRSRISRGVEVGRSASRDAHCGMGIIFPLSPRHYWLPRDFVKYQRLSPRRDGLEFSYLLVIATTQTWPWRKKSGREKYRRWTVTNPNRPSWMRNWVLS